MKYYCRIIGRPRWEPVEAESMSDAARKVAQAKARGASVAVTKDADTGHGAMFSSKELGDGYEVDRHTIIIRLQKEIQI